jgi:hypothetical protein
MTDAVTTLITMTTVTSVFAVAVVKPGVKQQYLGDSSYEIEGVIIR